MKEEIVKFDQEKLEISKKINDIEKLKTKLRLEYMNKMKESKEYLDLNERTNSLKDECRKIGHTPGRYEDNGFGVSWRICSICGSRINFRDANKEDNMLLNII